MTMTISGSNGVTFPDSTIQNTASEIDLLGTLTTTSGTTQVLSGLNLSGYKQLFISIGRVSHSNTTAGYQLRLESLQISGIVQNTSFAYGTINIDLLHNGVFTTSVTDTVTSGVSVGTANTRCGESGITTASTSLTFDWATASTFDSGTIKVYGVK